MYELLTMGEHPLYNYGKDNAEIYRQKLQKCELIEPKASFSQLATNFF